ncbi:MAG: hypothetical protein IKU62_05900 [Ruminiclostridium sp.]|nr:hypothetical protein [Ruminiclostridium sp.]
MKQYLLTPPHQVAQAQALGLPLAHMAYQLDRQGRLVQAGNGQGDLMLIGVPEAPEHGTAPGQTVREILTRCAKGGFLGVILDLETPPTPYLARLIRELDEGLAKARKGLFLPETYSAYSQRALLYLSSAISGGSLEGRLREAAEAYGPQRLTLSLHRTCRDFFLPSPDGQGRPISQEELHQRMERLEPRVFFSPQLCARYFTYMSRDTGAHFVLFDDGETLKKKRDLALSLGIQRFFWVYPEIEDIYKEIFRA